MTKFSAAYVYTISLVIALLVGACSVLSPPENDKDSTAGKPDTVKPSPPQDHLYEVGVGDTLSGIAKKTTGKSRNWKTIADLNNITDPNTIRKGLVIVIPHYLVAPQPSSSIADIKPDSSSEKPLSKPVLATEPQAIDAHVKREVDRPARTPLPEPRKPIEQEETGGWLLIRGTNYPREINTRPDSSSDILTHAWPGTRMEFVGRINSWYKVNTDKGQGYLNPEYATMQP